MKCRQILFSAPMIAAILAGRKTQTRRVLKAGFDADKMEFVKLVDHFNSPKSGYTLTGIYFTELGTQAYFKDTAADNSFMLGVKFPFGNVGDALWVREKWRIVDYDFTKQNCTVEYVDGKRKVCALRKDGEVFTEMWLMNYVLKEGKKEITHYKKHGYWKNEEPIRWMPSIHMPREASRICLEITGIRVERLHDISEADAVAEGIEVIDNMVGVVPVYRNYLVEVKDTKKPVVGLMDATASFMSLWGSIHGTPTGNPWVWVIEFKWKEVENV